MKRKTAPMAVEHLETSVLRILCTKLGDWLAKNPADAAALAQWNAVLDEIQRRS